MGLSNAVGLFSHPSKAWVSIATEKTGIVGLVSYLLVMAAIPTLCGYVGVTATGWDIGGHVSKLTADSAIQLSVLTYLAIITAVVVLGRVVHWMASTYGSSPSMTQSVMMISYAATPLFLSGVTLIKPHLWTNVLALTAGISYATYLLFIGVPKVMNISQERGILFASSVLTIGLVVLVAILAVTVVLWGLGVGPVYTS
jgi:Yip1 domain